MQNLVHINCITEPTVDNGIYRGRHRILNLLRCWAADAAAAMTMSTQSIYAYDMMFINHSGFDRLSHFNKNTLYYFVISQVH